MEEGNKLNSEPIVPEEVIETSPEITNPKDAGRKSVEEDKELQRRYFSIYYGRTILRARPEDICNTFHISLSTYKNACKWVRKNLETISTGDTLKDVEVMLDAEIRLCDKEIKDLQENGTIICYPNTATPITKIVDGREVVERKIDKNQVNIIKRRKMDYQRMLIDAKGLYSKTQNIFAEQAIVGNININQKVQDAVEATNGMADTDKLALLGIIKKYEQSPSAD